MGTAMQFSILGPVAVVADDGGDITPRGAQQRRLLAALLAAAPDPVDVATLTDVLWADGAPSANALQAQVSKLRRRLDPVAIVATTAGYALAVEPDQVDHLVLESAVERAPTELEPTRRLELLTHAVGLVRGRPLPELEGSEHGLGERGRLEILVDTAGTRRVEAALDAGAVDVAAADVEAALVRRPLDEHLWSLLMIAQYRLGRQADALRTFQRARHTLVDQLGVEPGPELTATERRVLAQDPTLTGPLTPSVTVPSTGTPPVSPPSGAARDAPDERAPGSHSDGWGPLPAQFASVVGRDQLVDDLAARLGSARLVTLVGPGGIGKTTVMLELCRRHAPDSSVVVELGDLAPGAGERVLHALAEAVGIGGRRHGGSPIDADDAMSADGGGHAAAERALAGLVVDVIGDRELVLAIDNCEHVLENAVRAVRTVLAACPRVSVVATSREPLGVEGELVVAVPPLDADPAHVLFIERANAAGGAVERGDPAVASIVERLDRLPLAIELAAARSRTLSLDELASRLERRMDVLSTGVRTRDQRQRTIRDVVGWSFDLLDGDEQAVFRRLAPFRGGATIDAAEEVCADGGSVGVGNVLGILERLVDKSLLVVRRSAAGTRFHMLDTIREFAAERLADSGDQAATMARFTGHYARTLAPAQRGLLGKEQQTWIRWIGVERENLRAALDIAVAASDAARALELTVPLGWFGYIGGDVEEVAASLELALDCPGPSDPTQRAFGLTMYGWLLANGDDVQGADAAVSEAETLLSADADPWTVGVAKATRTMVRFMRSDLRGAERRLADARAAASAADDRWLEGIVDIVEGEARQFVGQVEAAERCFSSAAEHFEAVGDAFGLSLALGEGSEVAELRGDYDRVVAMLERSLELAADRGFADHPQALRARLGNVETLRGNLDVARQHHLTALDVLGELPMPWLRAMAWTGLSVIERRLGRFDDADRWTAMAAAVPRVRSVPYMLHVVLVSQGFTADARGDGAGALDLQRRGLEIALDIGSPRVTAYSLEGVAGALGAIVDTESGDVDTARLGAQLLGGADRLRRETGGPMPAGERFDVDRAERRLRAALGAEGFTRSFRHGAELTVEELARAGLRVGT